MATAVRTQEFDPVSVQTSYTKEPKRKSKIALAWEELKGEPAIKILDMRAVLR